MKPTWTGDVLVIGAGWSGMLTAKHCRENGLTAWIIEKSDHVGGVWKYEEEVPGGVMVSLLIFIIKL
jgi:cation diffusion facilitator CzcD-associated flavoprotein CzcO